MTDATAAFPWLEAAVAAVRPGARLVRTRSLSGGISAQMTALEVAWPDGSTRRLVLRVPTYVDGRETTIPQECALLDRLRELGLPVPTVVHVDDSRTLTDQPWAVFDYVEGRALVAPDDPVATAVVLADLLVRIHDVDPAAAGTDALGRRRDGVARLLDRVPPVLDDTLREGEIREALARSWPPPAPEEHRLLHGDFWPGNVLWHDGTVAAVIDWEEAVCGDRLADVGITRLDLLWVYGPAASAAFTDRYAAVSGIDMDDLPVWDLVAALRPTGYISLWASGWPDLGRPDLTSTTMRDGHDRFVTAALASLERV